MKHKIYCSKTFQVKAKDIALDSLFNLFPINFCWMDKNGYVLGCNQQVLDSQEIPSFTDIIGKHTKEIASESAWENTQKVIERGEPVTAEETHLRKDGSTLCFLSMKSPMKDCDGNIIGVVNIALDITERKSMEMNLRLLKEAAELADKVKTEFLTNMRHDLRTPLTGILSISEFLENGEIESSRKKYLKDIRHCAESMLNHLNQIVNHIKAESGEFSIIEKEFNIHDVLYDVHKMMLPVATSKKLNFTLMLDHIPYYLIGDAGRTQRILMNLVSNALKFTEKGFVKINAKWLPITHEEGALQLIIEDSGIGIPHDKQYVIFEKFHKLNPSHEGVYKGDGLGLNIVKQFLEDIRGEYTLKSDPGKGTVFKVQIPYKKSISNNSFPYEVCQMYCSKPIEELSADYGLQSESKKKKILLVEDHQIISRVSKDILEKLDLEVDIANNGKEALNLIDNQYNLVIMDIGLPDISGYAVTRCIRENKNPLISQVPVIAITAHSEEEEIKLALEAGVNEIFPKPLTQKLAELIKSKVS